MEKEFPIKKKDRKTWNKPAFEKLSLSNTESGAYNTLAERNKTNVYGTS